MRSSGAREACDCGGGPVGCCASRDTGIARASDAAMTRMRLAGKGCLTLLVYPMALVGLSHGSRVRRTRGAEGMDEL